MINLESIATCLAGGGQDKMAASLWRVFVWMKNFWISNKILLKYAP